MWNGIDKFEIEVDNFKEIYAAGDTISGKLIIQLNRTKKIRALKLRFHGLCKVHWSDSEGIGDDSRTVDYDGREIYFLNDLCVFGDAKGNNIPMQYGYYEFPFVYNLPENLPNSFEHKIGTIRYSIKAIFDRPFKVDHTLEKYIKIQSPFDEESSDNYAQIGIDDNIDKNFCCCLIPFVNDGNILVNIRVPKMAFTYGENVEATININNQSSDVEITKLTMKLEQVNIKIGIPCNHEQKSQWDIIKKTKISSPLLKGNEFKLELTVPDDAYPYSAFKNCSIIKISHHLLIGVHFSGSHWPIKKDYEIRILPRSEISTL